MHIHEVDIYTYYNVKLEKEYLSIKFGIEN